MALFLACSALALVLFSRYGTDSEAASGRASVLGWFAGQWSYGDFANNWIMLPVAAAIVWMDRRRIALCRTRSDWRGALLVAFSLFLHVVGFRSQLPRLSLASVVGVFWGSALAAWGPEVARALLFPACYVMLCFLGPLMVEFTMPLRLMASALACTLLKGVGIGAVRDGAVVFSTAGGGFSFNVADACSGLRSLITMTALAAPYAYFTLKTPFKRVLLFVLSVPLAMVANALRIFTLGVVAEWIGMKLAMALYHDLSGYILFFLSLLLLMGAGSLLDRNWGVFLCSLKQKRRCRG